MYKLKILATSVVIIALGACSSGAGSGNTSAGGGNMPTPPVSNGELSLNQSGAVPVFGSGTSTVTYIHNDLDVPVRGVTYSVVEGNSAQKSGVFAKAFNKVKNLLQAKLAVRASSADQITLNAPETCSVIPAHGSCALSFTTPALSAGDQGSSTVNVSYTANGKKISQDMLINYEYANTDVSEPSLLFSSPGSVYSSGQTSYTTVYVYGAGPQAGLLKNPSITVSNGGTIINGYSAGQNIAVKQIVALDVAAPTAASGGYQVRLDSSVEGGSSSFGSFIVNPQPGGAFLVASLPSVIKVGQNENGTGSMMVINLGESALTQFNASSANPVLTVTPAGSCATLAVNAACTLNLQVNTESSGSSAVTVNYGGSSPLTFNVQWYNPLGTALQILVNPTHVEIAGGESAASIITVSNTGSYAVSGFSLTQTNNGPAITSFSTNSCAAKSILAPNDSCVAMLGVQASVSSSAANSNVILTVQGTSNDPAMPNPQFKNGLYYKITPIRPVLLFDPVTPKRTIAGNNIESDILTLLVQNVGTESAAITGFGFVVANNESASTFPTPLVKVTDECSALGGTLAKSESCNVTFKLGPVFLAPPKVESGMGVYSISYSGGEIALESAITTRMFESWVVNPATTAISLTSVVSSNAGYGTGESSGSAFKFFGTVGSPQTLTLTYTNESAGAGGTNLNNVFVDISGVMSFSWQVMAGTTCGVVGVTAGASLAPNGSCTVVLQNVLNQLLTPITNGTMAANISTPTVIFKDMQGSYYTTVPTFNSGNTIYANNLQGIVTSTLAYSNPNPALESSPTATLSQSYVPIGGSIIGTNLAPIVSSTLLQTATESGPYQISASGASCSINAGVIACTYPASGGSVSYGYKVQKALLPAVDYQIYTITGGVAAGYLVGLSPNYNIVSETP